MNRKFAHSLTRQLTVVFSVVAFSGAMLMPRSARAEEPIREFVLASSYGVLAGTLVGAATLAFSDRPGDNLNKVARGASIGLYCGILLGFYIVYGVPSGEEEEMPVVWNLEGSENSPKNGPEKFSLSLTQSHSHSFRQLAYRMPSPNKGASFLVMPVVGERGIEGAEARLQVLSF